MGFNPNFPDSLAWIRRGEWHSPFGRGTALVAHKVPALFDEGVLEMIKKNEKLGTLFTKCTN